MLINQIDKKIDTESTINTQNQVMENIKLNIKEKKIFDRPPAGKKVTRWDNTIIYWKSSLRHR